MNVFIVEMKLNQTIINNIAMTTVRKNLIWNS